MRSCSGILSSKKEGTSIPHSSLDESQRRYAKWKKPAFRFVQHSQKDKTVETENITSFQEWRGGRDCSEAAQGSFRVIEPFSILITVMGAQIDLYTPKRLILPYVNLKNKIKKDHFSFLFIVAIWEADVL